MRVLTITHYFPSSLGGIEYVANALHVEYIRACCQARWAATARKAECRIPPGAIDLSACDIIGRVTPVPYPLIGISSFLKLIRAVKETDAVHVHDAHYMSCVTAVILAKTYRKKTVLTQHVGSVPYKSAFLRFVLWFVSRTICRMMHQIVDQVVFISPQVENWYRAFVHYKRLPMYVPNGVEQTRFIYNTESRKQTRDALHIPDACRVILFVGRFTEKKGLAAIRDVARVFPQHLFAFAGAGKDDPVQWELPNVRVLGCLSQEEMPALYNAADILILPSVGEGFPLVVQEAMSCGLPCLLSYETFLGWGQDAELFLLANPNTKSVSACIEKIDWQQLASHARRTETSEYARRHWNWITCAKRYMEIMHRDEGK